MVKSAIHRRAAGPAPCRRIEQRRLAQIFNDVQKLARDIRRVPRRLRRDRLRRRPLFRPVPDSFQASVADQIVVTDPYPSRVPYPPVQARNLSSVLIDNSDFGHSRVRRARVSGDYR